MGAQEEANKELARQFFQQIWNDKDESAIDRMIVENAAGNDPDFGAGREAFRKQWREWQAAFPDLHFEIIDLMAEGPKVLIRWILTGTHTGGPFLGHPATGKSIRVEGMSLDRIENGMVQEGCDGWDALGMRRQLGLLPESD
jgi:steroid delta-isomerase-like uncharacterized protein